MSLVSNLSKLTAPIDKLVRTFVFLTAEVGKNIVGSILTVILAVGIYIAWYSIPKIFQPHDTKQQHLQTELRFVQQSNKIVNRALELLVGETPHAARSRVALIHNNVTTITGVSILKFDITHSVAAPGRDQGLGIAVNIPLSQWVDYFDTLLKNKCAFVLVDRLTDATARINMQASATKAFLVCPLVNTLGQIHGAVFTSWDTNDPIPSDVAFETIIDNHLLRAAAISAAIDLRKMAYPH